LRLYVNGGYRCDAAITFEVGDWIDTVVTLDFSSDEYKIYHNGNLEDTDTTSLSAPTLTQWNVGGFYTPSAKLGKSIAQFAALDRVLTATEIANLWSQQRPLVDGHAMHVPATPGAYKYDLSNDRVYYLTPNGLKYAGLT
jgi:hypothetical protein